MLNKYKIHRSSRGVQNAQRKAVRSRNSTVYTVLIVLSAFLLSATLLNAQELKPEIFVQLGHTDDITSVAYSPDGKYVLSGSDDKTLKLWEVSTGREIRTFEGHSRFIESVAFSPDGRHALSGGWDGTTRIWDINSGKEIVKIVAFEDDEWVVITPEGYYNASIDGAKYINVQVGNMVYSVDKYAKTFYRPDLVQQALDGESLEGL